MSKKILTLVFSLAIVLSLVQIPAVAAAGGPFTISGKLETTDPKANHYEANYKLTTSGGSQYYLKLTKDFYKDWVGKEAHFNVNGNYVQFAAFSSGLGKAKNTVPGSLPTTGPEMIYLLVFSLLGGGLYLSRKKLLK